VRRIETEQEKDDQQLKQATDRAAMLQDELIQAADRERQLRMQLNKMKDDVSRLQKDVDKFQLEHEMMQRDSAFNWLHLIHFVLLVQQMLFSNWRSYS